MLDSNLNSEINVNEGSADSFILKLNAEIFEIFERKLTERHINHCLVNFHVFLIK
jgi:hypothetical protein